VLCVLSLVSRVDCDADDPHCTRQLLQWKTCEEHVHTPFGVQIP
jgi:hypothetical protein